MSASKKDIINEYQAALLNAIREGQTENLLEVLQASNELPKDQRKLLINGKDDDGYTALMWAAERGDTGAIEALLEAGADHKIKDAEGWTAFHWAVDQGFLEAAKKFIHNTDIDTDIPTGDGSSALKLAAANGNLTLVEFLLDVGADLNTVNGAGESALHWAAHMDHVPVVTALIKRGANVAQRDKNGATALHYACRRGHLHSARTLLGAPDAGAKLLAVANKTGVTALHWAAAHGFHELVRLLMPMHANPADIDRANDEGFTALHEAAFNKHAKVITALLSGGANINAVTKTGASALHIAAAQDAKPVVRALLVNHPKPDLSLRDLDGCTCVQLARSAECRRMLSGDLTVGTSRVSPITAAPPHTPTSSATLSPQMPAAKPTKRPTGPRPAIDPGSHAFSRKGTRAIPRAPQAKEKRPAAQTSPAKDANRKRKQEGRRHGSDSGDGEPRRKKARTAADLLGTITSPTSMRDAPTSNVLADIDRLLTREAPPSMTEVVGLINALRADQIEAQQDIERQLGALQSGQANVVGNMHAAMVAMKRAFSTVGRRGA